MTGLYSILELPVFSDISEIKKSYKRLAYKYHPDVNNHDKVLEEKFKKLNRAYQILSDENKKRRYDELLRYKLNNVPIPNSKRTTQKRRYSSKYSGKQENSKKAKTIYNAMALGLFGMGIILFQVITKLNEERLKKNYEDRISNRNELIESSKLAFKRGELRNAMNILSGIGYDVNGHEVSNLKNQYFSFSDSLADNLIQKEEYDSAKYYLKFLLDYKNKVDATVYSRISACYRHLGQQNSAIDLMQNLIMVNPNHLMAHKELAHIYQYDLGDYRKSLGHYEVATKIIVKNYVDYYGKAYIAIINPKHHPPGDFDVFLEKSKIYYDINEIDSALVASRWASFLEPTNSEAQFIQGLCWLKKGNRSKACQALNRVKNSDTIIPELDSLLEISC